MLRGGGYSEKKYQLGLTLPLHTPQSLDNSDVFWISDVFENYWHPASDHDHMFDNENILPTEDSSDRHHKKQIKGHNIFPQ